MNSANAVGFFLLGLGMGMLPVLVPGWFPASAIDGSSTHALWLEFMGTLQLAVGAAYLARPLARAAIDGVRSLAEQRGAVATGDWQPDSTPPSLVMVDFAGAKSAAARAAISWRRAQQLSGRAVFVAGEAAARWMTLGAAAEARVTNLVGRPADADPVA